MIDRVIFIPEAEDDVAGSYDWYESREPGLGEHFLRSVEACVRGIQRHPDMYPAAIDEFRRAPIRRFPCLAPRCDPGGAGRGGLYQQRRRRSATDNARGKGALGAGAG